MNPAANQINERWKGTLVEHLGIRFIEAGPDRVVAELEIKDHLRTVGAPERGPLHGGTLMAFADSVGATGTVMGLKEGQGTATVESKTNFFAAGRAGIVRAEARPIHKGRRTEVWETRVTDAAGKLLSLTLQTQMIL